MNARLIMANTAALEAASRMGDGVTATSILQLHAALMAEREQQFAGRWREQLGWIGRSSFGPVGADSVAPQAELIPGAIDDLIRYVARADLPVIEQIALAHAQFETIHPFVDGNGRTGRALMQAMLRTAGLVRNTTLPISSGLLGDVDGYHAALIAYQAGDADTIITLTAGVVSTMSGHTRGTYWKFDAMLDALDAFAARSGPGR